MTLLRRRGRALYRVYSEDCLEIDDWLDEAELDLHFPDPGKRNGKAPASLCEDTVATEPGRPHRRGLRRLLGVAVPAAVAMAASAVAVHALRTETSASGRRGLGPRGLPASASSGSAPTPVLWPGPRLRAGRRAADLRAVAPTGRARARRPRRAAHVSLPAVGRRRVGSIAVRGPHTVAFAAVTPASPPSPAPSVTDPGRQAPALTASRSMPATAATPQRAHPEFGFER